MPRRPKGSPPSYRLHKQSGQAIVSLPLGGGAYRDVLLGRHGSPESHAEYARVIAEWRTAGCVAPPPKAGAADLTVGELLLRFWRQHVEIHYRDPDGNPTSEVHCYRLAMRPLRKLYSHTPAASFGPLSLKAVRARLVEHGHARRVVNQAVSRIRRCFAWAVAEELIPPSVLQALQAVKGLRKNRSAARESEPVGPVADAHVDATLAYLHPTLRAMVAFSRLTGARPGETCRLRLCDVNMSGRVWLYRPHRHKTEHLDRDRVVPIGPKAQEVIKPFFTLDTQAYLFSPARAVEGIREAKRKRRRVKLYPSELKRRAKRKRRLQPGVRYAARQYAQAVERACDRAFPPPAHLARRRVAGKRKDGRLETVAEWRARLGPEGWAELEAWRASHRWAPNQLRHSFLTEVRRGYGLEAAQVIAGHARADTTQIYAERDMGLAERVAAEIG